jgi:hypothetical protein
MSDIPGLDGFLNSVSNPSLTSSDNSTLSSAANQFQNSIAFANALNALQDQARKELAVASAANQISQQAAQATKA